MPKKRSDGESASLAASKPRETILSLKGSPEWSGATRFLPPDLKLANQLSSR